MSENRLFLSGEENKYSSAVTRGPRNRFNSKIPRAQFFSILLVTSASYLPVRTIRFCSVINVKNFHGSLTTVVRAQNDTSKTANITDTMFDRTYWYSPYKRRRFENR